MGDRFENIKDRFFRPESDITAYEVALILNQVVRGAIPAGSYDKMPPELQRHFK